MISFEQTHILDGQICGTVYLDTDAIGEFRVDVAQWDELRGHVDTGTEDALVVLNNKQVEEGRLLTP